MTLVKKSRRAKVSPACKMTLVALQMSTSKSINKFEIASTLEIGFKINIEQKLHDR